MKIFNPSMPPFKLSGFPFFEEDGVYRRLPLCPRCSLPEAVYYLADETAGGQIRFHGKIKQLTFRVSLASRPRYFDLKTKNKSPHLAATTKFGFDVYISRGGGEYEFIATTTNFYEDDIYYESTPIKTEEAVEGDFLINFPLYGAVDKVLLGFDDEAEIAPTQKDFTDGKRIIMYGMSIEQGACASRPGMCDSNILSRWFNREVINLGFNSSGKCEAEVAELISDIDNVAAITISTDGNSPDEVWLDEKLREFIRIYRTKHPKTPIIVTPSIDGLNDFIIKESRELRVKMVEAQERVVKDLHDAGDENLYLLHEGRAVMEESFEGHALWHECLVDGAHKTDLGFLWTAKALYKFLLPLI
jgi:hypothetical protein